MKFIEIKNIKLYEIDATDRLRAVDAAWVEGLSASLSANGLQQPLQVIAALSGDFPYKLVAGAHRLKAAEKLGWEEVRCQIMACDEVEVAAQELEIKINEIDENLIRHELSPYDRAVFLAERKRIYEELHPETKKGKKNQFSAHLLNENVTFSKNTAEKINVGTRTIERAVKIFKDIETHVWLKIAGTDIAASEAELYNLSKLGSVVQLQVLQIIFDESNPIKKVRAAAASLSPHKNRDVDLSDQGYKKLLKAWDGADGMARQLFTEYLEQQ